KVAGATQAGSFQYARYEPLGLSVHIMPFNFPILLMCWTVAASLAAGNCCVIKPAIPTTLSTLIFMEVFADLPEGLIACLPGDAALGEALIASPKTHAVAFTGSVAAGRAVAMAAAAQMKPAVIEAGGSDPMIISAHAPLDVAAAGAVTGAFHLSGQVCTSTERIYVVDSVHDEFVAAFAAETRRLRIGPGLGRSEIGPLVSEAARARVIRLVEDARDRGATVVTGGRIPPEHPIGWFYEPTILTGCTPEMALFHEECFGPVAAICRVADFEEAIAQANASPFGLGASIFTTSLEEAMEAAERLEAGMVWVNNPMIDNDALPFGGWKQSGIGRELSRLGLDTFRRSKMVVIDHKPVRQGWWYPYPDDWFYDAGGRKHV
ncbi:MAG TPA: aldehyde dehydrogenase family protein, partial [Acidisoma sp.]|uniref:aldehyde dehydrogenase family protein n=1 Tax=Acidisoma sp. TaxID=1872115 RepID=UPI002CBD4F86